ncbi:hypothetical protein [Methylomonas koyamae]|uniref:hypothetical protein n=1 Tax=Methylomonas koyamae TaxID=702114 RepID=UPI0016434832|nr:hypothetical protein [Methylomonas koyamae]
MNKVYGIIWAATEVGAVGAMWLVLCAGLLLLAISKGMDVLGHSFLDAVFECMEDLE